VRRVGETEYRPVDVRFVSATHRGLERMVAEGHFREDLFFRLAVLPLRVPPLRERASDIPLLMSQFLPGTPLGSEVLGVLEKQRWPGNVRQLKSFAERVAALGLDRARAMLEGTEAAPPRAAAAAVPGAGPLVVDANVPFKHLRETWVDHLEREYLKALIDRVGRNAGALADAAELDRSYVNRLLKKHGF
jgi:DNA-binding NtrC family response regulator